MTAALYLAWRYVLFNRLKSIVLIVSLTLTLVLPLTAQALISVYGERLMARAVETPLIAGAKGSRFDLVLKALYFAPTQTDAIHLSAVDDLRDYAAAQRLGVELIPLHSEFTARGQPLVGAPLAYFDFRGLTLAEGDWPVRLGQCVLGASAAELLQLKPGDKLFSDQTNVWDISETYPLRMHVSGVLAPTGGPDDRSVFVDLKTAWLVQGIMHGHRDVGATTDDPTVLRRDGDHVVTNATILEYNEVTDENIASFHLHAQRDALPISVLLVVPASDKARTMLKSRLNQPGTAVEMLTPRDVIADLLGLAFQVKRFFDASFALVVLAVGLSLLLVLALSRRLRARELSTMARIGASRWMTLQLQVAELLILLTISGALAAGLTTLAVQLAPRLLSWI